MPATLLLISLLSLAVNLKPGALECAILLTNKNRDATNFDLTTTELFAKYRP